MQQAFPRSDLIQRYYGFMLGFITNLLLFEFAKPGYGIHKSRIDEVLTDLGTEMRLPARHAQFLADKGLRRSLAVELKKAGKVVTDFYAFGTSAFYALIEPSSSRLGRSARGTLGEICSEYRLEVDVVKFRAILSPPCPGARRVRTGAMRKACDYGIPGCRYRIV